MLARSLVRVEGENTMSKNLSAMGLWVCLLLLALPSAATARETDEGIAFEVRNTVFSYSRYGIFDGVDFSVENGVVTLTGRVTHGWKANEMMAAAARVDGVLEVDNQIVVLPASIHDKRLRYGLYRGIYGQPTFRRYVYLGRYPVHIVVEKGHVTLSGAVPSSVWKRLALNAARSMPGVFVVNDRISVFEAGETAALD